MNFGETGCQLSVPGSKADIDLVLSKRGLPGAKQKPPGWIQSGGVMNSIQNETNRHRL
jgi:hypothetical protein